MLIKVLNISPVETITKSDGKSYSKYDVSYKDLDSGKITGKTLVSFNNPEVFAFFRKTKPEDTIEVESVKKDKYWEWVKATVGTAKEVNTNAEPTTKAYSPAVSRSTYETPEERKIKQRLIVRQATLNAAIEYLKLLDSKVEMLDDVTEVAEQLENWVYRENTVDKFSDLPDDIPE